MRYYCPICKIEIINPHGIKGYPFFCPICEDNEMQPIPEWETPNQYQKRTGREWKGAIWVRFWVTGIEEWGIWLPRRSGFDSLGSLCQFLCAQSDTCPPDDYEVSNKSGA